MLRPLNSGVMWLREVSLVSAALSSAAVVASLTGCMSASPVPEDPYRSCFLQSEDQEGWVYLPEAPVDVSTTSSVLKEMKQSDLAAMKGVRYLWFMNGAGEYARCELRPVRRGYSAYCSSSLRKWYKTPTGWKPDDEESIALCHKQSR